MLVPFRGLLLSRELRVLLPTRVVRLSSFVTRWSLVVGAVVVVIVRIGVCWAVRLIGVEGWAGVGSVGDNWWRKARQRQLEERDMERRLQAARVKSGRWMGVVAAANVAGPPFTGCSHYPRTSDIRSVPLDFNVSIFPTSWTQLFFNLVPP